MQMCTIYGCEDSTGVSENRRFFTREEKIEMLNEYKETLEKEAKGVKERIFALQKEKTED